MISGIEYSSVHYLEFQLGTSKVHKWRVQQDDVAYYSEPEREISRTPKELPRCETIAALPDFAASAARQQRVQRCCEVICSGDL